MEIAVTRRPARRREPDRALRAAARGSQVCLEAVDCFDAKPFAAVAELSRIDTAGKTVRASPKCVCWRCLPTEIDRCIQPNSNPA